MAGVEDRVQGFLKSWAVIEKNLNEILQEGVRDGNRLFDSERSGNHAEAQSTNSLQTPKEEKRHPGS